MSEAIAKRMSFLDRYLTLWTFLAMATLLPGAQGYGGRISDEMPIAVTTAEGEACRVTDRVTKQME